MNKFEGLPPEATIGEAKFLRVEKVIYTTAPEDVKTLHMELAEAFEIHDEIVRLKQEAPARVDGGYIAWDRNFGTEKKQPVLLVHRASLGYSLPRTPEARAITIECFRKLSPGLTVIRSLDELRIE